MPSVHQSSREFFPSWIVFSFNLVISIGRSLSQKHLGWAERKEGCPGQPPCTWLLWGLDWQEQDQLSSPNGSLEVPTLKSYKLQDEATLVCESEQNPIWLLCEVLVPEDGRNPVQLQLCAEENTNGFLCHPCKLLSLPFCVRKSFWISEHWRKWTTCVSQSPLWRTLQGPGITGEEENGRALEEVYKALCGADPLKKQKGQPARQLHVCLQWGKKGHKKERRTISLGSADGPLRQNLQL